MKPFSGNKEPDGLFGPSAFSGEGFMGNDSRTREKIIADDAATLTRLSLNSNSLCAMLHAAYNLAERMSGAPAALDNGIVAVHHEARGRIPSPFPCDGTFEKGETHIIDTATGQEVVITPLSLHLIEKYGFFQGKGSRYRLEPDIALGILQKTWYAGSSIHD